MTIEAKVIADSISNGVRLTTMELKFHRFILPEFNTHRMFSRNASSSRAIPVEKMLEQVQQSPAIPIHWGRNKPGMQAGEEIDSSQIPEAENEWQWAVWHATLGAKNLNNIGVHKQVVNRLLEPFQYIKVIVTSTEWEGFFRLRLHSDAQPEIQRLAENMRDALKYNNPVELNPGQWHLPYVNWLEEDLYFTDAIKCSAARCARVSYLNHDASTPNIEKDLLLADKLLEAGHMSPFEHQASPFKTNNNDPFWWDGQTHIDKEGNRWSGNFRGWIQYRQLTQGN